MIEDDHSLMGGVMIRSHGGFELVVDRLVSCCKMIIVDLQCHFLDYCSPRRGLLYVTFNYLSLSDCVSLIR